VRLELGFLDLVTQDGPDPSIEHMFADVFTKQAQSSAERWAWTAADTDLCNVFPHMWHDSNATRRGRTADVLRAMANRAGLDGGW
jgi:hypothetical protein